MFVKDIKNSILRIVKIEEKFDEDGQITLSRINIGTGFFINEKGYFLTAKHLIWDVRNINIYKVIYQNTLYSFQKIDGLDYSNNEVDIIIFKININNNFKHISLQKIDESKLHGNVTIMGYPNQENEIKSESLYVRAFNNGIFELKNQKNLSILKGCSGSPILKKIDNSKMQVIGVMSSTSKKDKVSNFIFSINLIEKINYIIKKQAGGEIYFGSNCLKTSLITKVRLLLPCIEKGRPKLIYKLHREVEHKLIELEYDLKKNYLTLSKQDKRLRIKQILLKFKKVFDVIAGDVSIHIKLVHKVDDDKAYCKAISRVSSNRETDFDRQRKSTEEFIISNEENIDNLQSKYNLDNNDRQSKKINSAYNQVIYGESKYWICNDLISASKENKYYSTSNNYGHYYNSLAIFVITDKDIENNISQLGNIKGLLIIDSIETGCFHKSSMKELGGYLTHKLNRFLSNIYFEDFFINCNLNFEDN